MAGLTPLPQHIHHHTTRLTHAQAHTLLSQFLRTAETDPSYRPDSTLSQAGVQSSSAGAGQNLTLNHLERILKGIAGERVGGGSDSFDAYFGYRDPANRKRKFQTEEMQSSPPAAKRLGDNMTERVEAVEQDGRAEPAVVTAETDGWQDKEDFEHAQVEGLYDLMQRDEDPTRASGRTNEVDPEDVEVEVEEPELDVVAGNSGLRREGKGKSVPDKEARKRAKKDRLKEEKRARQKEIQQSKSLE